MPTKLQETINFFELYRHICGESEVPDAYNFWAAVSLIAATVEDRVWWQKFKHELLFPNLFIMLVGPSGLGKGTAIGHLVRLAECSITLNKYRGKVTSAHLIDHLGKPRADEWGVSTIANPKLWLIMDELQNDVSSNRKMVEEFIYLMTELYTASNYTINTGTRMYGEVNIQRPIINWLAGTNEDDLRKIITKDLLNSGFAARTCFIFGRYDFELRVPRIKYPPDYEEVFQHLCMRLWILQRTKGPFLMTAAAEAEIDKWYITRPGPEEELMYSAWKRQHDLLLKFAMILCLADGRGQVIEYKHIRRAKMLVRRVYEFSGVLVKLGSETYETRPGNEVAKYIQKKGKVGHTEASKYFRSMRGMNARLFKAAIVELIGEGVILAGKGETGGVQYEWNGGLT